MPQLIFSPFEIDYSVNQNATISFDAYIIIPDWVPDIGGRHYIGGTSVSVANPYITIPISIADVLTGSITFGLFPAQTRFEIGASAGVDLVMYSHEWSFGPISIPYMIPLVLTESAWNPPINAAALAAAIENAPANQIYPGRKPPPLRNDSGIQQEMAAIFEFVGLGDLNTQMVGYAQAISNGLKQSRAAAGRAGDSGDSGVLIALGLGGTAGFFEGFAAAGGFWWTTAGDYGLFGSIALDVGVVAELTMSAVVIVFWPDANQTAESCFSGYNFFVSVGGGEAVGASVTLDWPESGPGPSKVLSWEPCGVAVSIGACGGIPVTFVVGNSYTWKSTYPPPAYR